MQNKKTFKIIWILTTIILFYAFLSYISGYVFDYLWSSGNNDWKWPD